MNETPKRGRLRPLFSGAVLRAQSDERLSALAGAGNAQAFAVIFERYRRELGSQAAHVVRLDRVDDVVQQAMLAVWSALLAGADIADVRAWLHRAARNAALDAVAKRGYEDGELPDTATVLKLTENLVEERLSARAVLAAVAALPEGQRRALMLTAIDGHSGHDAARAMGISENAMYQLVYRARRSVRLAVTALTPPPLINWLLGSAAGPAMPGAVGLSAGGVAGTAAKVVAVIGVAGATLGAPHAFDGHRLRHPRDTATGQTARTSPDAHSRPAEGPRVDHATLSAQVTRETQTSGNQLAAPQHTNSGAWPSSADPGSGGGGNHQSGSQSTSAPGDHAAGIRQPSPATSGSPANSTTAGSQSQVRQDAQSTAGNRSGDTQPNSAPTTDNTAANRISLGSESSQSADGNASNDTRQAGVGTSETLASGTPADAMAQRAT